MVIVSCSSFLMDGSKNLNIICTNVRKYTQGLQYWFLSIVNCWKYFSAKWVQIIFFFLPLFIKKESQIWTFLTFVSDDLFCDHHPTQNSSNKYVTFSLIGMHKKVEKKSFCAKHGNDFFLFHV